MSPQEITSLYQNSLTRLLLDGLFPYRCYGCGTYDTLICSYCLKRLPRRSPVTVFFDTSKESTYLDSLTSPLFFKTPLVSLSIHDYKFQGITLLTQSFASLLLEAIERSPLRLPTYITAVPLHPKRLRERGYNQSDLLARELSFLLNEPTPIIHHVTLLKRTKNTSPQSKQPDRKTRLEAMRDVFALKDTTHDIIGSIIWLIDDVTTTHATLEACAKVLKQAGASEVHGIVIAR